MANLSDPFISPGASFTGLLNTHSTGGLTALLQVIEDGFGNPSPLSLSNDALDINTTMGGGFSIDTVLLTASATQINSVCTSGDFSFLTTALTLPKGTTAQRPAGVNGEFRYNTTTDTGELYAGGGWVTVSGGTGNAYFPGGPTYIQDTHNTTHNLSIGTPASVFGAGENIVSFGYNSLQSNITGSNLTCVGIGTLQNNTFGNSLTSFGENCLNSNIDGSYSSAFGSQSNSVSNASNNNTFGFQTLNINADGSFNSVFGTYAMALSVHGSQCSAFGEQALGASTEDNNSAFGWKAGLCLTAGVNNTFVGARSGGDTNRVLTGCTFLGYDSDASVSGLFNATAIGAKALVSQDNTVILGSTTFPVNIGIGTSTPSNILHVVGSAQLQGISAGYTGSGLIISQYGVSTTGAGTNTIDFPVITTVDNQMVSKVTISVMQNDGLKVAYATSVAAAFYNGASVGASGSLPTITFTGSAAFAVDAAWSISGNNLRLTVTGIAGTNAVWVVSSEVFSSRSTTT